MSLNAQDEGPKANKRLPHPRFIAHARMIAPPPRVPCSPFLRRFAIRYSTFAIPPARARNAPISRSPRTLSLWASDCARAAPMRREYRAGDRRDGKEAKTQEKKSPSELTKSRGCHAQAR